MTIDRYVLSQNAAYDPSIKKSQMKARSALASTLRTADNETLSNRLGATSSKSLISGKKVSIKSVDVQWLNRNLKVMRILPYGKNRVAQQFQFLVTTVVQFEKSKKKISEEANYFVIAKTLSRAHKLLKSRLKAIYPHIFFNTDWELVKIRVAKVELVDTLVGVAKGDAWIFD